MSSILNRAAKFLGIAALMVSTAYAANGPKVDVRPKARITTAIDVTKTTVVTHSHPTRIANMTDNGRVDPSTPFEHMLLVLKSSDEQEWGIQKLLDEQQDRNSANFHQWLTPETFGAYFGVEASDLQKVTSWLQQAGFTVNSVTKGARIIDFSGTSGMVEAAFGTEMHNFTDASGAKHISNISDVSIPVALQDVVLGPARLNNFKPVAQNVGARKATFDKNGKVKSATAWDGSKPLYSDGFGDNYVGAADLQTLYDTTPMYALGFTGAGQTIGIVGQTDILQSDDEAYRSFFGLPPNPYIRIQVGNDPGTIPDDVESDLDVELSGSLGYNATINFYTSGNSFVGGGVDSSTVYMIESNVPDIISESYGECEQDLTAAATGGPNINGLYNTIYGQAAAQGQSIFISTGDSGPDVCSDGAVYSVNGLASTPYNVAVGGTEFDEALPANQNVWGPATVAVPFESALSYIPEVPWNEGPWGIVPLLWDGGAIDTLCGPYCAGSSGISFFYTRPAWQAGTGIPVGTDPVPPEGTIPSSSYQVPGPHRLMPDVAANAAVYQDPTLFCSEGICQLNPDGSLYNAGLVGGTSVAAPTMASVQALINQANGGRQGNPDYYYYRVANAEKAGACNSNTYVVTETSTCGFHDVVSGNTFEPSKNGATPPSTNYIGWPTNPGFDMSAGLGSPDVAQLSAAWNTVTFNATTTTFTLTPLTSVHGVTYTANVVVTPASGTGTPTGSFALIATALSGNGIGNYNLTAGKYAGPVTGLPGGTYKLYARYSGDTTFGSSTSLPITVTVTPETPTITVATYAVTTTVFAAQTTFTYGSNIYVNAGLEPPSTIGTPTGSVTFTLKNTTSGITEPTLTVPLDPNQEYPFPGMTTLYKADAYLLSSLGITRDDFVPNYPVLLPGTYTASVTYPGDNSFGPSTSNLDTFVVTQAVSTLTETPVTLEIPVGGKPIIDASVTTIAFAAGGIPPTGTVTFTDTTTNTPLGTATLVAAVSGANSAVEFTSPVALTTVGAHTITAVYSGDSNYATATKTATVTVGGNSTAVVLTTNATTAQVGTTVALSATVSAGAPTDPVYFFDGTIPLGTATRLTGSAYVLNVATFTAGTHVITATYSGSTTAPGYDSATSSAITLTITKNTPIVSLTVEANNTTQTSANTSYQMNFTPSPQNAAPMNPAPTGSIGVYDGTTLLGSGPITYYSGYTDYYVANYTGGALKPGPHSITAKYPGDANYAGYTTAPTTLGIGLTTTTLTVTPVGTAPGLVLDLSAAVAPVVNPSSPALTGTVSFYLNTVSTATLLGKASVVSGVATLNNVTYPAYGASGIIAVYSGDTNYYTSTSALVGLAGFTISVAPSSLTISQGNSGSAVITVTSYGGYAGYGTFLCQGLPANSYCTFGFSSGNSTQFSGTDGVQTVNLTIQTNASTIKKGSLLWLPAMMLAAFLLIRRKRLSLLGKQLTVFAILLFGTVALSGCANGSTVGSSSATPIGTTNVTIVANGVGITPSSPNVQPTAVLSVTVQ